MEYEACRLCLEKITGDSYVSLEDFEKNMLETLIPVINTTICCDAKMCDKCSQMLQISFDFKAVCLANNERLKKVLILKEVCRESNCKSCCFCGYAIFEEINHEGKLDWKEMVEKCIPELDIYSSDDLSACEKCLDYLKDIYKFVEKCLETEEAIRSYSSSISENSRDSIKLSDVIKMKNPTYTIMNNKDVSEQEQLEKVNTSEIFAEGAHEAERCTDVSPPQAMQSAECLLENFAGAANAGNDPVLVDEDGTVAEVQRSSGLEEHSVNTEEMEPNPANGVVGNSKETSPQVDIESFEENFECPKENSAECAEREISGQRMKETKHSKKYKCGKCSYEAKYKSALVSHWMSHKGPSETTMFKCHECDHETKRKGDLRAHMLVHKNPLVLKMFKCADCPYESKRKVELKGHSLVHSTHKYKCKLCPFETNSEKYLNTLHVLVHKEKSEIKTYKCDFCPYEAKSKGRLRIHTQLHKSTSEVPMFKCNWCNFETRYKTGLKSHLVLLHKCPSEIAMFECHMCGFQTKRKSGLKGHIERHNKFRSPMYQCDGCTFETPDKSYLQKHRVLHKDPSEVKMYKCELCTYKSRLKGSVKSHMLTHIRAARMET